MTLPELSVRRPVLAVVAALLVIVAGLAAVTRLPVREYPDVDPPIVSVSIVYPGASAEVVERDVTQVVEDNLNGIEGVDVITSTSRAGFSRISIRFELDRALDAAAADVRDRVSAVGQDLPDEAEEPVIRKSEANASAMMWITLTSDERDRRALTDVAIRTLVDPLSIVDGVSQVIVGGERRYAMRVRLDRGLMAARGVTAGDVAAALRRENVDVPAGRVEMPTREYTVRTETKLLEVGAFEDLVIRDGPDGSVRLGDVATVELGAESDRSAVFRSGEAAVGLGIVRQSGSNTLAVASRVKEALDALGPLVPDDVTLAISYDQSIFIERSIEEVVRTLFITVALVVAVVWLSLGALGATLVPAATIPAAVVGAFAVMAVAGFSVNTLTLLALVLAIGLVVDDAIVVVENVTRRREEGDPPLAAAVRGAGEVFLAVVATTLVLVAVLVPIAALTGTIGRLFTEFAITLAATVVFSSFLALTLGAMLASRFARPGAGNRVTRLFTGALARAEAGYRRLVSGIVGAAVLVVPAVLLLGAGGYLLARSLPGELAPTEDRAVFIVPITAPEGATLSETEAALARVREILEPYTGEDGPVEDTIGIVGTGDAGPPQVNSALAIVKLRPWEARRKSQQALVEEVLPKIVSIPGAQAVAVNPASLVPDSFGKPIQMAIAGPDYDTAYRWAQTVRQAARALGSMRGIELSFNRESPQLALTIDRRLAADLGLDAARIGEALRVFFGSGTDITEFYRDGETYEVMVRGAEADRDEPTDIGALQVRADDGSLVPLATVVDVGVEGTAASYRRVDRRPSVVLTAVPAEGADLGSIIGELTAIAANDLPPEAQVTWLGLSREFTDQGASVIVVFALAILVVYLTLAALFSSFLTPFVVILAVPLAIATGMAALWATGGSLNIFSQIGLLLAVGLLAKNAILVVDFAGRRRAEGMDPRAATEAAAEARFRPIVMTSVATLFGALPLALATGPGAESRSVIGVTVMAGVVGATLITLFVVPALYRLATRFTAAPGATSRAVDRELDETEGCERVPQREAASPAPGE